MPYAAQCSTWNVAWSVYELYGYICVHNEDIFAFMAPCVFNVFKHDQQDATLHSSICYYICSTCFRRFLRPSSGAQNCTHSIGYLSNFFCFLPLSNSLAIVVRSRKSSINTRCFVYSFELLMMRRGTA